MIFIMPFTIALNLVGLVRQIWTGSEEKLFRIAWRSDCSRFNWNRTCLLKKGANDTFYISERNS